MSDQPYLGQNCTTPYSRRDVIRRVCWSVVQATLFRWSPRPLHAFRARLLRLFGADIPEPGKVVIFPTARVTIPWNVSLESRAMVGPNVTLYSPGPITLKRGANVSQDCYICSGTHDYLRWSMPVVTKPVIIGENTWLAAGVFVAPGVTIGALCVVGARSVVVSDLPPRSVCVGNPCRPIRGRPEPEAG